MTATVKRKKSFINLTKGCIGGVAQLVVACPVDLVKIKLQTQTGANDLNLFSAPLK
jgi:hypothetical protein